MCSSNQLRLGLNRLSMLAWTSPTNVWSRKIRMIVTVAAAMIGASSGSKGRTAGSGGAGWCATATSSAPMRCRWDRKQGEGATMQANATGSSRLVATPVPPSTR